MCQQLCWHPWKKILWEMCQQLLTHNGQTMMDDDVELRVLGCWVDILGTNCDQRLSMVQCCFTSTETVRFIRTGNPGRPPRLSHSSWTLICPEKIFNTKYPEAKSLPILANGGLLQETTGRNIQPSPLWIKESPSSEIHVSRMPKLHTAKADSRNQLCVLKTG